MPNCEWGQLNKDGMGVPACDRVGSECRDYYCVGNDGCELVCVNPYCNCLPCLEWAEQVEEAIAAQNGDT